MTDTWTKVVQLIELAMVDDEVSRVLREGPPSEVAQLLYEQADISMEDLAEVYKGIERIADISSLPFWMWLEGPPRGDVFFEVPPG